MHVIKIHQLNRIKKVIEFYTTFYPKIQIRDSDSFRNFPRGTRFDKIAYDYYGDASHGGLLL